MRALFKVAVSLSMLAVVLIALTYGMLKANGSTGPVNPGGRLVSSEIRAIGKDVRQVELSGPIAMTMRHGAVASLVVRGETRMLGNVETVQDGDTLHIGTTGMLLHHRVPLQVVLVLPFLDGVASHGSGDSTINGMSGERIELRQHGSGSLKFSGRYRQVVAAVHGSGELEIDGGNSESVDVAGHGSGEMTLVGASKVLRAEQSGSGDLNARHLTADLVVLQVHGSGTATVTARKSLSATLRGSGDVDVYGAPAERSVNRSGSGEVDFKE